MQALQVLVDRERFRQVRANAPKLNTLEHLLREAASANPRVDLVVLPAGYLTAATKQAVSVCVAAVGKLAKQHGVAVVFGVDLPRAKGNGDDRARARRVATGRIPYWGFALDKSGATLGQWRQQSIRSGDVRIAPPLNARQRLVQIAGRSVAVMVCGEIFNARYRDQMRAENFDVVIDIGHESMSTGVVPALMNIVDGRNRWALHSHHVKVGSAQAHAIEPGGQNAGVRSTGAWREVPPGGWRVFTTMRTV